MRRYDIAEAYNVRTKSKPSHKTCSMQCRASWRATACVRALRRHHTELNLFHNRLARFIVCVVLLERRHHASARRKLVPSSLLTRLRVGNALEYIVRTMQ